MKIDIICIPVIISMKNAKIINCRQLHLSKPIKDLVVEEPLISPYRVDMIIVMTNKLVLIGW